MMKRSLFTLAFLYCVIGASAQRFTGSIDLQIGIPQGEFEEANPNTGIGGRLNFLYRPKNSPIKFGTELGLQVMGSRTQYFGGYVFGFYEEYKVSASNNIFSLTLMPRLQSPKHGKVKPFLDVVLGWNVFFSSVNVERLTYYSQYNDSYGESTKGHWAFTFGPAAGIDIPLSQRDDAGIEIKCAYLIGRHSKYLTDPRIDASGQVSFTEKESATTMLLPQIGVRFNIR